MALKNELARLILPLGLILVTCNQITAAQTIQQSDQPSGLTVTNLAGSYSPIALRSVFRILCPSEGNYGTGFLHKSGVVITAAHVVLNCFDLHIALPDNKIIPATVANVNNDLDLAILQPSQKIQAPTLPISNETRAIIGSELAIYGFPIGYNSVLPMLSVGYLSGSDAVRVDSGGLIQEMVLNAAINLGNSGSPVIDIQTGQIIGVTISKLAPLSSAAQNALNALQSSSYGLMYTQKLPDGTTKNISEGQVVGLVLDELRQQVQLVIGRAVTPLELRTFLQSNRIDP